jgi:hypothetical protein
MTASLRNFRLAPCAPAGRDNKDIIARSSGGRAFRRDRDARRGHNDALSSRSREVQQRQLREIGLEGAKRAGPFVPALAGFTRLFPGRRPPGGSPRVPISLPVNPALSKVNRCLSKMLSPCHTSFPKSRKARKFVDPYSAETIGSSLATVAPGQSAMPFDGGSRSLSWL